MDGDEGKKRGGCRKADIWRKAREVMLRSYCHTQSNKRQKAVQHRWEEKPPPFDKTRQVSGSTRVGGNVGRNKSRGCVDTDEGRAFATGGRTAMASFRLLRQVRRHSSDQAEGGERDKGWSKKGMGLLEISVGMIAGWARWEAVEKFCGKKVKIVGGIVERAAVFRNWGKGEVVEGVKDGEGGIEVVSEVEIRFISEN